MEEKWLWEKGQLEDNISSNIPFRGSVVASCDEEPQSPYRIHYPPSGPIHTLEFLNYLFPSLQPDRFPLHIRLQSLLYVMA